MLILVNIVWWFQKYISQVCQTSLEFSVDFFKDDWRSHSNSQIWVRHDFF